MPAKQPLAARMRPTDLSEIIGQEHLIFSGSPLQALVDGRTSASVLLYGPPGVGKTTIASVIAGSTKKHFLQLSATSATVKDVRAAIAEAEIVMREDDEQTLLFIDEIHRFSKAQQDSLLPAVEHGVISLIAATTENPSFSIISPLVSRSILMVLREITEDDIVALLRRALASPKGLDGIVDAEDSAIELIADLASGDARQALGRLEVCADTAQATDSDVITEDIVRTVTGAALQRYDRNGDQHYDIISAFIKSMRGSDPQGTLYWLARMIDAGEDPRFIARRIMVHASEDVGMAAPSVLTTAVSAAQATQMIGLPEARIILAQAALAVALAPKSPGVIRGIDRAMADVTGGKNGPVPYPMRDNHYKGAKALGHGAGYRYPHDYPYGIVAQQYLPDNLAGSIYYEPTANGYEQTVTNTLDTIEKMTSEE